MRRATGVLVLAVVLAVAGGSLAAGAAAQDPAAPAVSPPRGLAGYQWDQANRLTPAATLDRLRFLRDSGFKTIYLEVGDYLDWADRWPSRRRSMELEKIRGKLRKFVATASSYGLAVHAVSGAPDWTGELSYLGRLLVKLVGSYNAGVRPAERLRGVQLDIEPYAEDRFWAEDKRKLCVYLDTLHGIVTTYRWVLTRPGNRGLQLGFAIPFWLDSQGPAGRVRFRHREKFVAHHIIDMIWDLPGAYLVVMSYRNQAAGDNGSIALAREEFDYAAQRWAKSGLVVGQQYGPPEDNLPNVSFHEQKPERFWREAAEITRAFKRYRQFRGLALDGVDDYREELVEAAAARAAAARAAAATPAAPAPVAPDPVTSDPVAPDPAAPDPATAGPVATEPAAPVP
jgi:hypothetical protein